MNKEIYVFNNLTEYETIIASESKEKIVDYAVDYIMDCLDLETKMDEEFGVENFEDEEIDEYLERYKTFKQDYEKKVRKWAIDLANGNYRHHYSNEFSNELYFWIKRVELI